MLQGFRLVDDAYESIEIEFDGESYRGFSSALGLELHARKDWFRFFNPATGEYLKNLEESERARVSERRARENEQTARLTAERERDEERARREDLERVLREHGIEHPS